MLLLARLQPTVALQKGEVLCYSRVVQALRLKNATQLRAVLLRTAQLDLTLWLWVLWLVMLFILPTICSMLL